MMTFNLKKPLFHENVNSEEIVKRSSTTMDYNEKILMKSLMTFAVEKILLNIGKPVFEKVVNKLQKEYKCFIPDCYEHPEYLKEVLKNIFGNSHVTIIERIQEELVDYSYDEGIKVVLEVIKR